MFRRILNKLKEFYSYHRILFKVGLIVLIILTLIVSLVNVFFQEQYKPSIFINTQDVPDSYAALVMGAGVDFGGIPSPILHDRVVAAVELYKAGKVKKLIMSGDNRVTFYDEPSAMVKLAESLGVPKEDIQPDYAGKRTYDSCYRAKNIFQQNKIIIVTQEFHMTRSLFICKSLGIESYGYLADRQDYGSLNVFFWKIRDNIALFEAISNIYIFKPEVTLGDKIKI